jgi:hypothetical protein
MRRPYPPGPVVSIAPMPADAALADLQLHSSGKVREMYEIGDDP